MGICSSTNKIIESFKNYNTILELKKEIIDSKLLDDFDLSIFIDCSLSNDCIDGTSLHDIPFTYPKINKHTLHNPYLYMLDIVKDFVTIGEPNINLHFFGTNNADKNKNLLEKVNYRYNYFDIHDKVIDVGSNECANMLELINAYVGGLMVIRDKQFHNKFGANNPSNTSLIIPSINQAIEQVKISNRYTISLILSDGKFTDNKENIIEKIYEASKYPLSIIFIGIGDIDFNFFKKIDRNNIDKNLKKKINIINAIKEKKFDNFRVMVLNEIIQRPIISKELYNELFLYTFMEVPQQYNYIKRTDILNYQAIPRIKSMDIESDNRLAQESNDSIIIVNINRKKITNSPEKPIHKSLTMEEIHNNPITKKSKNRKILRKRSVSMEDITSGQTPIAIKRRIADIRNIDVTKPEVIDDINLIQPIKSTKRISRSIIRKRSISMDMIHDVVSGKDIIKNPETLNDINKIEDITIDIDAPIDLQSELIKTFN
jgi:hypothetical protein